MSDFTAEDLTARATLSQIDRNQAELRRLLAEAFKLDAEAAKLRRDTMLAPIALALTGVGAGAALFAAAQALLRMLGG